MVSLTDIVDLQKTVTVRGQEIPVEGINAEKLGFLINAHPELRAALAGRSELKPEDLIGMGPAIVASIIAAGTGETGKAAAIEAAAKLTVGEQVKIIAAIFESTFPDGFGPFVEKIRSFGVLDASAVDGFGWVPPMNSQKPSNASSPTAAMGAAKPS